MAPVEREPSRDGDRPLRHQHSMSSDQGRALVPMWDSSDPDRAPPPLPLNPQSPSVTSRKGTSSAIQSAHAALTERARESAMVPVPLSKRSTDISPERSIMRGSQHKRMQSLQPGTVRDLSLLLESGQQSNPPSPTKSPERAARPSTPAAKRRDSYSDAKSSGRESPTPSSAPSLTPVVRPAVRRQHQSILGENTPPQSATMLAIQNMPLQIPRDPENVLSNVTNGSNALVKPPQSVEALSGQLLSLTNIATALQKDMAQLSRRSRDNATDLLSLKEATKARDEDIRKSLRELINNAHDSSTRPSSRDPFASSLFLDAKPNHTSPPASKAARPFSLPRIPSPNSFAASIDRDSLSTPSLCNSESPTTMAILDKIIRDMGTKEGHDLLLARLTDLAEKLAGVAPASKVDELIQLVKSRPDSVSSRGDIGNGNRPRATGFHDDDDNSVDFDFDPGYASQLTHRSEGMAHNEPSSRSTSSDLVSEELLKIIRTVKDSVAQGGGLTAEVKALVRELRGEVLGMGREIGRRLDEVNTQATNVEPKDANDEVAKVIHEGLDQMREQMNEVLREHRRQSASSVTSKASAVDYQEIYNAMRAALRDSQASQVKAPELSREDVIDAVRDAWESYKPEVETQDLGFGKEEILEYLKQGLQDYVRKDQHPVGASREEVFQAVVEGLKHFAPPRVDTPASLSRDEILDAVRECLEEFEFPVAPSAFNSELTREDMLDAVKEGLSGYDLPTAGALVPHQSNDQEIVTRLQEILDFMRSEFRVVSEEAKRNVAANGRDAEQLLDATKEGLDKLRRDMQDYVSQLNTSSGQEEITQTLLGTLDTFRDEMACLVDRMSSESRSSIESHMESLRDTVNSSMVPATPQINQKEIIETVRDGIDSVRAELRRPFAGVTEILDALHDGLADLRISIDKVSNRPADLTANDEILDALKAGLDSVRSDIDGLRDQQGQNDRALTTMNDGAIVPADALKQDDIKNLEVLITQLRVKIEAMEPARVESVSKDDIVRVEDMLHSLQESASKDDILRLEDMLRLVQESVSKDDSSRMEEVLLSTRDSVSKEDMARLEELLLGIQDLVKPKPGQEANPGSTEPASRDDVQAIETILRNTKGRLDDLIDGEQAVRKEHIDSLENIILETREAIGLITTQIDGLSRKEDMTLVESLVTQVAAGFEEMKESAAKQIEDPERVTKTDVDAVEAVCLDIKNVFDQMLKTDLAALATKEDVKRTGEAVEQLKSPLESLRVPLGELKDELKAPLEGFKAPLEALKVQLDALVESHAKGSEERQAEIVGVGDRVSEVKSFLEDFQGLVKSRLEDGVTGIETLAKLLQGVSTTVEQNASIGQELKDLSDTMKIEFEESKAGVVGAKLESDEKFLQTTEALSTKIDEKVTELMAKYDDFQAVSDERAKAGEARDADTEAAMLSTKAVAEDLKSLVDTLGAAVTDSMEKMEEASKTVFNKVEDLMNRTEENHTEGKAEHQQTRDHLKQALDAVEGLQGKVGEVQPEILETVKNILLVVGQHYDYAQTSTTDIQQRIEEAKPPEHLLLPPPEKYYDDTVVVEKLNKLVEHAMIPIEKYNDATVQEKLDKLVELALVPIDKYDDTTVQAKLDNLAEQALLLIGKCDSDNNIVQEKLDKLVEHASTPVEKYDDAVVHEKLDKLVKHALMPIEKYDDSEVHGKLDKLVEHSLLPVEKYNDAPVHEKLDRLVEYAQIPAEKYDDSGVHEKLDELVDHTHAAERAFSQLETLEKVHQQVIQTAADISLFLANQTKRITEEEEDREKTLHETNIALERQLGLKEQIQEDLLDLKKEEERLKASVLGLRNEQESLIRQKIRLTADVSSLETALHLRREELHEMETRAEGLERRILEGVMDHSRILLMSKATKGRDTMSRKRVKAQKPSQEPGTLDKTSSPAVNLALSGKRNLKPPVQAGATRRILSLSQITNNVPAGGVQRSQSVRTTGAGKGLRKSSWGGSFAKGYGELDKENMALRESEEESMASPVPREIPVDTTESLMSSDDVSDAETLRRSSRGTTVVTESTENYNGDGDYSDYYDDVQSDLQSDLQSEWTESAVSSNLGTQETHGNEVVVFREHA
ncbi:hypothetical protein CPLU01_06612 [Colletotrichum plurivorum]|uniref:Chromosome segregation ATPase n=1 Tax=Colletotrichum plurivorum TaxID=2175906 RepID=A0A8H6KHR3_9PEZI|nr:hypothetical protein CPLU01_06612 [Colletotrichum plurivorum]